MDALSEEKEKCIVKPGDKPVGSKIKNMFADMLLIRATNRWQNMLAFNTVENGVCYHLI